MGILLKLIVSLWFVSTAAGLILLVGVLKTQSDIRDELRRKRGEDDE